MMAKREIVVNKPNLSLKPFPYVAQRVIHPPSHPLKLEISFKPQLAITITPGNFQA